jgi:endonuclease/exonuclease/phosphatase family metal-dependent hydrolase
MAVRRGTVPRIRRLKDFDIGNRTLLSEAVPYLGMVRAPSVATAARTRKAEFSVATYNVHRWTGLTGGTKFEPERAISVIAEVDADVVALQEVLRPFASPDPLGRIAEELRLHVAFVVTRVHKYGELGNAILSRWPITSVFSLDLSFGRLERRSAIAAEFHGGSGSITIVATHLALVDGSRNRQVRLLLEHPRIQGSVILLGDVNAWRNCRATKALGRELPAEHHNLAWPPSFPSARPLLALDRVYARGAKVLDIHAHATAAARRASDHLPVVARIGLPAPKP